MSPKKKYWLDCLFATLFVFVTLYGLKQLTTLKAFDAFDPVGKAFGDMELTDITFSQLREDPIIDENVVIVNIGNLSRAGIAQQIMNISACKPRVIGLDIIFACDRDTLTRLTARRPMILLRTHTLPWQRRERPIS